MPERFRETLRVDRAAVRVPDVARVFPRPPGQISLVMPVSTTCDTCGCPFTEEVPLILDALERPALWSRAMVGALARFACPNGHEAPNDRVSCVLRDRRGDLVFVAGDAIERERWEDAAAGILGGLPQAVLTTDPIVLRAARRSDLGSAPAAPVADTHEARPDAVPSADREAFREAVMRAQDLVTRYERESRPEILDAAVAAWNAAITHPVFADAPAESRALVLRNAGTTRYLRSQKPLGTRPDLLARADLDAAVRDLREAHRLLPPNLRASTRNNLILALGERYERVADPDELDEVIALLRDEVADSALEPERTRQGRDDLAHRLWQRFGRRRDITDIDDAVRELRTALASAPKAARPHLELSLGMCLSDRAGAVGDRANRDESIELIEHAASAADSTYAWNEVGNARLQAYSVTASADMLDSAIRALERAVELSVGGRDRPGFFGNLGNAYLQRWDRLRARSDIDAAIKAYEQAVELEEALDVYGVAVVGAPPSPMMATALVNLARALRERASELGSDADSARADELLGRVEDAIQDTDPESGLFAAQLWGDAEVERENWARAADAYIHAQDMVDRLVEVQLGRRYQEARLRPSGEAGARAAFALARDGRLDAAAVACERARARLLADALERDRLDLERLAALGRPGLVDRYRRASATLTGVPSA